MLKNKLKIIALLMVIILTLMIPIVRAEDNEADGQSTEEQSVIEGAEEQATQSAVSQENYKQGDVYLTGDEVTIDYIIDGNLFVIANTVNINSQIGGDAFIIANNVFINEGGYIFSNLFTLSNIVNINGVVYDLYACSNSVNINGYIYRDVRATTDNLTLSGTIGRNAYLSVDNIQISTASTDEEGNTLTSQGSIYGDLNYEARQEISIPDGIVTGSINYTSNSSSAPSIQTYILSLGRFLVTVLIIWLLCLWLAPKFLNRSGDIISKKLPSTIGFGILTPIILLIVSAVLLLLGIASTIAGLGLVILFTVCMIGSSIFVIAFNNLICKKLNIEKSIGRFGVLIITAAILWLIALIPVIGGAISIITSILGIGILINGILPSNRNKDFSEDKSEKNKEKVEKTKKVKSVNKDKKSKKESK